jgi:transcriptional regulator with XRE-family HTH domain
MKTGEKIRLLREERKLSLADVAQRVSLEIEQLESIESGAVAPSLGVLIKLARVIGVRLGTFLDDQLKPGACITRKGDAEKTISLSGPGASKKENLSFYSLASQKSDRHMEPFIVEILPGNPVSPMASTHEGEEFIYVLKGSIAISYGKDEYILGEGDSIYLDSIVKHMVRSANNEKALLVAVVYLPV